MNIELGMCPATLLADAMGASPSDVRDAIDATAANGFTHVSVWAHHISALGDTLEGARRAVDGAGLRVSVVVAALGWASGDVDASRAEAERLRPAIEATGASLVLAACMDPSVADMSRAQDALGVLAETVGRSGASVALEFLPWSPVPDLATAWELVEPLGAGAGITLDTWHWQRQPGGPDLALLRSIPAERVPYLQLADAAPDPSPELLVEAMTARLLPGDGVVDYAELLATLHAMGARPVVVTEVFRPSLVVERGSRGAAATMRNAARAVIATAPG
jgi:sugar phosphate isomerase/epimerase